MELEIETLECFRSKYRRAKYLGGLKFGRLTALRVELVPQSKGTSLYWMCVCECGAKKIVQASNLKSGSITSCGCYRKEATANRSLTHGDSRSNKKITAEYRAWHNMTERCYNPNDPRYKDYGGRNITICERWRNNYSNFLEDMGRKPTSQHSLDRIDNDGNYCKENCRWATPKEQANNRRPRTKQ